MDTHTLADGAEAAVNRTIYIRDEDVMVWERARELADGEALSQIIIAALKDFIKQKEVEAAAQREADEQLFHQLWSKAVHQPGYDKAQWLRLEARIAELRAGAVNDLVEDAQARINQTIEQLKREPL